MGVQWDNFELTEGSEYLKGYNEMGDSGKKVERFFCMECGSPLFACGWRIVSQGVKSIGYLL